MSTVSHRARPFHVRDASTYPHALRRRSAAPAPGCGSGVPDEAERLAQLVHQEPLVREVEGRRDVGEEDERRAARRRPAPRTGCGPPSGRGSPADGWRSPSRRTGSARPSLTRLRPRRRPRGRSSRAASASARRSAPRCAATGAYSRNFSRRRISSSNVFGERPGPSPFTRSHLLTATTMPQPARSASPAIAPSCSVGAFDGVDHEHGDVGGLDRPPRDDHAERLHLARPRHRPGRRMPAVSTIRNCRRCHRSSASTASRVVPGMSLTSTRSSRSNRLTSEDLPTFGRPMIATPVSPGRWPAARAAPRRLRRPRPRSRLRRLRPAAPAGARRSRRAGRPPPGRARPRSRPPARSPAGRTPSRRRAPAGRPSCSPRGGSGVPVVAQRLRRSRRRQASVPPGRPRRSTSEVGLLDRPPPCSSDQRVQRVLAGAEHARRCRSARTSTPCQTTGCEMTSRVVPGTGVDDRAARRRDPVEQRGLADVGPADQHDDRAGACAHVPPRRRQAPGRLAGTSLTV